MMNSRISIAAVCMMALSMNSGVTAEENSGVIMTVNGDPVSEKSIELMIQARQERGKPVKDGLRDKMKDEMITRIVLSQQARRKSLDEDEDVRAQRELNDLAVLSQAYLRDYARGVEVDESEMKSQYEKYLEEYDAKEYRVRQILLESEDQAKEMISRIQEGEDFAELAKEHSIDPGASLNEGDLGWFRPDVFVDKRLSRAVEELSEGEYSSEPVQTRFGWHVVKVEQGPRKVEFPTYEQLSEKWKQKMRDQAVMQKVNEHVKELVDGARVKVLGQNENNLALQK
ncbi:peptidylprolyl isomerase [Thiohalobacter thiocyanaticus]|uniref:peptidylprolyl isomerase n=1 Tax=Thiohalobacter thiocyanaticus TaxID=585455 RepID=A0A426QM94_9GAMM|nr:peptidylprolyl isomerase [Thiohalobacter thiocyanaticus]RRQ22885.1 hypothetical protein D6C00_13745 [Thiohalobacter thiocyanaticus]